MRCTRAQVHMSPGAHVHVPKWPLPNCAARKQHFSALLASHLSVHPEAPSKECSFQPDTCIIFPHRHPPHTSLCCCLLISFCFCSRPVTRCLLMTSWQAGRREVPASLAFRLERSMFSKEWKHYLVRSTFQHWIFLFQSPAGLLLSPSVCFPLSFPPASFPDGDWQGHLYGDRAP